ncbi:hypothetical protein GCM10010096_17940 [Alcaligenes pakistanensis]|uniref:Uncharacterized protein n=1 Tax=Alcaligenes pakistanensis TaxID=1482717 RepID=A0A8H9IMD5_9BURK|nr:hypothetical protein GCM10010096_17940 [Alcaligenes pakistanensis]
MSVWADEQDWRQFCWEPLWLRWQVQVQVQALLQVLERKQELGPVSQTQFLPALFFWRVARCWL